jgi:hypothetical protein
MRKFLVFLLIAVIACAEVAEKDAFEDFEIDLDSVELKSWLGNIWNKIKSFGQKVWNGIKGGVDFLKRTGIWNVLKTAGKAVATTACSAYLSPAVCGPIIGLL